MALLRKSRFEFPWILRAPREPWEHRERNRRGIHEVPDLTFDWPRVLQGPKKVRKSRNSPVGSSRRLQEGENGNVRSGRCRSSLQGLASTHPPLRLTLFLPFQLNGSNELEETSNRTKASIQPYHNSRRFSSLDD